MLSFTLTRLGLFSGAFQSNTSAMTMLGILSRIMVSLFSTRFVFIPLNTHSLEFKVEQFVLCVEMRNCLLLAQLKRANVTLYHLL